MKKFSKKQTLIIGISVIVVCLLISAVYMLTHRSLKREPTAQEIEAYGAYEVDWQSIAPGEGSDKETILSLCTYETEKTIGENDYKIYTSETLGNYLHDFAEMSEIALLAETTLYVQYSNEAGDLIILGYTDEGLREKSIYDLETDTLFYELDGTAEVWTNFRNGFQWGE